MFYLCPFTNCPQYTSSIFLECMQFAPCLLSLFWSKALSSLPWITATAPQPHSMKSVLPQNPLSVIEQSDLFKIENMTKTQTYDKTDKIFFICSPSTNSFSMIIINTFHHVWCASHTVNASLVSTNAMLFLSFRPLHLHSLLPTHTHNANLFNYESTILNQFKSPFFKD